MNTIDFNWGNFLSQTQAQISTPGFVINLVLTVLLSGHSNVSIVLSFSALITLPIGKTSPR